MKRAEINTRAGKRRFIRTLCNSVRDELIAKVERMPADWDGHELRELIADTFNFSRTRLMRDARTPRVKKYHADAYNQNL